MILTHDLGTSLSLARSGSATPLWTYVYGGKPKPFVHPLATPAGHVLSLFEPSDHVWQRGLWFAVKFVNGHNFWEEKDGPFGTQVTQGPPAVTHHGDAVRVSSVLRWLGGDGVNLMNESRTTEYRPIDADAYALDFTHTLTPVTAVVFDRTPFNGTWGGYGGLAFRGNRNWVGTELLFDDATTCDRPTPKPSKWCDLTGPVDGGRNLFAGVTILDHPGNPRHPTGWYGSTGPHHYFNAAWLFHEPYPLDAGDTLTLRYRVLVHDGVRTAARLNADWRAWIDEGD